MKVSIFEKNHFQNSLITVFVLLSGFVYSADEDANQLPSLIKLHNESYSSISGYYTSITDLMRESRKGVLSIVLNGTDHAVISMGSLSVKCENLEPLSKDSHILDVGCAVGDNLVLMSEQGFGKLTGIDVAQGMIAQARDRLAASWICGDVMEYHQSHDLVFAQALIHLFPKKKVKEVMAHLLSLSKQRFYFSTTLHEVGQEGIESKGVVVRYRSRYTLSEILTLAREFLAKDSHLSFHYFILQDPLDKLWINGIFERRDVDNHCTF